MGGVSSCGFWCLNVDVDVDVGKEKKIKSIEQRGTTMLLYESLEERRPAWEGKCFCFPTCVQAYEYTMCPMGHVVVVVVVLLFLTDWLIDRSTMCSRIPKAKLSN